MKTNLFLQQEKKAENAFPRKQMLLALLPSIVINAVLPLLIYRVMTGILHQPMFLSLIATGIPPLLMSIVSIS